MLLMIYYQNCRKVDGCICDLKFYYTNFSNEDVIVNLSESDKWQSKL